MDGPPLQLPAPPAGGRTPARGRCAAHPARPAVDRCPVCDRPRCGADARTPGCPVCGGRTITGPAPRPPLERLVRAALSATVVALLAGVVCAQYVESGLFAYVLPLVTGVLVGAAAQRAAHTTRVPAGDRVGRQVRAVASVYAPAGVALGFVLERSVDPVSSAAALPLLAGVLGAVLWTQPPRRRRSG